MFTVFRHGEKSTFVKDAAKNLGDRDGKWFTVVESGGGGSSSKGEQKCREGIRLRAAIRGVVNRALYDSPVTSLYNTCRCCR